MRKLKTEYDLRIFKQKKFPISNRFDGQEE